MEKAIQTIVESCQSSPRGNNLLLRVLTFNHYIDEHHGFKLLSDCNLADYENFLNSEGMTALFDVCVDGVEAMGNFAATLVAKDYDVNGVLFCITDGWNTRSTLNSNHVAEAFQRVRMEEQLDSLVTILLGVNPGEYDSYLKEFMKEANFDQYEATKDASPKSLARLANFVSQSVSSVSKSLVSGTPSQPVQF